jgi:hypothetical protein
MKRKIICLIALIALVGWVSVDSTYAKKSRSSKKTVQARSKKISKKKSSRSRGRHARRGRRSRRSSDNLGASAPRTPAGIPAERVSEIQTALSKLGYYQGEATGQYDEATVQAVKQFQSQNSLRETGLPSATMLKKLGVSKSSNDGYSIPVRSAVEAEKKP